MVNGLIARGFSGAIRALTGARALWEGCGPSADRRVYFGKVRQNSRASQGFPKETRTIFVTSRKWSESSLRIKTAWLQDRLSECVQ